MSDQRELLEEIIFYAIRKGDQDLWDILYPHLKKYGYLYKPNIVKSISQTLVSEL